MSMPAGAVFEVVEAHRRELQGAARGAPRREYADSPQPGVGSDQAGTHRGPKRLAGLVAALVGPMRRRALVMRPRARRGRAT